MLRVAHDLQAGIAGVRQASTGYPWRGRIRHASGYGLGYSNGDNSLASPNDNRSPSARFPVGGL